MARDRLAQRSSVPKETLERLREFIRSTQWKTASSPQYRTAPHSYIIFFRCKAEWKWFADLIREHGEYRTWRSHKYKYLIVDGECFWVDWPALNRADVNSLDSLKGGAQ